MSARAASSERSFVLVTTYCRNDRVGAVVARRRRPQVEEHFLHDCLGLFDVVDDTPGRREARESVARVELVQSDDASAGQRTSELVVARRFSLHTKIDDGHENGVCRAVPELPSGTPRVTFARTYGRPGAGDDIDRKAERRDEHGRLDGGAGQAGEDATDGGHECKGNRERGHRQRVRRAPLRCGRRCDTRG